MSPLLRPACLALLALAAPAAPAAAAAPAPIKVGEFASLTGKEAAFGQSSHKGTPLAVEEINAAGGVLGKSSSSSPRTTSPRPVSPPPSRRS
jgi:branched-chain amino acid transport system substrate-binding protein